MEIHIRTDQDVYEPAADTELLVKSIRLREGDRVLDLGTGTGVVAIHCAKHGGRVTATDVCMDALELARANVEANSVQVDLLEGDMFEPVEGVFDVVIFNPPYLPTEEEDLTHSPLDKALDGGPDGTEVASRFIRGLGGHLAEEGRAYLVVSSLQDTAKLEVELTGQGLANRVVGSRKHAFETISVWEIRRPRKATPAGSAGAV
jgi:release factor glutamine methyltransferase